MKIEPCTQQQLDELIAAVGRMSAAVGGLFEADLSRGRGVLDGNDRCLWDTEGRRITVSLGAGAVIIVRDKNPDPEAPESGLHPEEAPK